jgi:hypothetical protein
MTSVVDLFDNFALRISQSTDPKDLKWDLKEIDDEFDYFEVPEEKMSLIAYREQSLVLVDLELNNFRRTFTAPQKNKEQYFTLKDLVEAIVEFEKEVRLLDTTRNSQGLFNLDRIELINMHGQTMFSLNWTD